jgi:hypothetical protein
MIGMQDVRTTGDGFGLGWALGVSVVVHVLLALLFLLFVTIADAWTVVEETAEDEDSITFTFSPEDPIEDYQPYEEPPPSPTQPTPEVAPVVAPAGVPLEPSPASIPVPPIDVAPPPEDPIEPVAEPFEESFEEPVDRPEDLEQPDPVEETGILQPPEHEAPDRIGDVPRQQDRARPQVDMHQALRDFSRAIQQAPRPESRANPLSGAPRNVYVPDFSQIPSTGFGVGNVQFESRDYDWSDYGRQVYMALWRAWHNRLWRTTDDFEKWAHRESNWYLDHQTRAQFTILRNGQVTGIAQLSASGCGPLDASALDALEEVILPPLPDDFPRNTENVRVIFAAHGEIRWMRPTLNRMKAMGAF